MNKKVISALVATALLLTVNGTVYATPQNASAREKMRQTQEQIETLDNQITVVMNDIDNNKKSITKITKEIGDTEKEIKKSEESIKSQKELYNKRVRAMYINGVDSYLNVILDAGSIGDFLTKVEAVKSVIKYDNKIINEYKDKKQGIEKKKETLESEKTKVLSLKSENEKKLSKLNNDKKEASKLVETFKAQERQYGSLDGDNKEVASAINGINSIRSSMPSYNPSRGSATMSGNAIVAYASNFQGTPYVYGANGPGSFDCSGFTKYVFAHFGINLPRVAADQQGVGTSVSRGELQPGDLVFFGSPAHHVGIYVGNNSYIHAPQTGDVVKVSSMDRGGFSGGKRVK